MSTNDIWYGILDAGDKSTPVVRDLSMQAASDKVWLYNHVRNAFVEYSLAIVEPKLRELAKGDITQDELDRAFKAARQAYTATRKIRTWDDKKPAAKPARKKEDAEIEIADDDEIEEFIDDADDDE